MCSCLSICLRSYDEFHIAERLRMNGWVVPAYTLAKSNQVRLMISGHRELAQPTNSGHILRTSLYKQSARFAGVCSHVVIRYQDQ
jgi:hypothetical protein